MKIIEKAGETVRPAPGPYTWAEAGSRCQGILVSNLPLALEKYT